MRGAQLGPSGASLLLRKVSGTRWIIANNYGAMNSTCMCNEHGISENWSRAIIPEHACSSVAGLIAYKTIWLHAIVGFGLLNFRSIRSRNMPVAGSTARSSSIREDGYFARLKQDRRSVLSIFRSCCKSLAQEEWYALVP